MASSQTNVEVNINVSVTNAINGIVDSLNSAITGFLAMQSVSIAIDYSELESTRDIIVQAAGAIEGLSESIESLSSPSIDTSDLDSPKDLELAANVQPIFPSPLSVRPLTVEAQVHPNPPPTPANIPFKWKSSGIEVYTGDGLDRFRQEAENAKSMMDRLSESQDKIASKAMGMNILPNEAFHDLNGMAVRIDNIRDQINQISSAPVNMRSDKANAELEKLREKLNQAVQEQDELSKAMEQMDASAINAAYLRLNQTINGTEQYIRDNTDEQGQFNDVVEESEKKASGLKDIFSKVKDAVSGVFDSDVAGFITEGLEAVNGQYKTEAQLMSVLANKLDDDYVANYMMETSISMEQTEAISDMEALQNNIGDVEITVTARTEALQAEFDTITEKASEIQSKGIYQGDVMIAGAMELTAEFSDVNAVSVMMDTLADYAAGMSGGGEVDSGSMEKYAESLAKLKSGDFGDLEDSGFNFSDAQKAIIGGTATEGQIVSALGAEYLGLSGDMQAAAVIAQVVQGRWGGLYDTMSNMPEGQMIQLNNSLDQLKETIGTQLYPYILLFVDTIQNNWGSIGQVIQILATGLGGLLGILAQLMEAAANFASFIIDNWSIIAPIVIGVVASIIVFTVVTQGAAIAQKVAAVASDVWKIAQTGLQAVMNMNPIGLTIILIIMLIAIIFAVCQAIAKMTGVAGTGFGVLCGVIAAIFATIVNLAIGLVNGILQIVSFLIEPFIGIFEWILNVVSGGFDSFGGAIASLIGNIISWFLSLGKVVTKIIDAVFGTDWTSGLNDLQDTVLSWGKTDNSITLDRDGLEIDYRMDPETAFENGVAWGDGVAEKVGDFDLSALLGIESPEDLEGISAEDYVLDLENSGMSDNLDNIATDTGAISDSMDVTQEDLKYLRDIAEQESINRYTLAEVKIEQTNHNNVSSGMDLDGVVSGLTDAVNEAVEIVTEGVHA